MMLLDYNFDLLDSYGAQPTNLKLNHQLQLQPVNESHTSSIQIINVSTKCKCLDFCANTLKHSCPHLTKSYNLTPIIFSWPIMFSDFCLIFPTL